MALRSSPILCLFDGLELTTHWLFLVAFTNEGPRTAAKRVARIRFRDVAGDEDEQGLTQLRRGLFLLYVVFLIGTLSQVLKIFACSSMLGTQLCTGFYLFNWTVAQLLALAAGSDWSIARLPRLDHSYLQQVAHHGVAPWAFTTIGILFHCQWMDVLVIDLLFWDFGQHFASSAGRITCTAFTTSLIAIPPALVLATDSSLN